MRISFRKLIFNIISASKSAHSELSYKKIPIKKFQKLMEKFKFYLNPVHFFTVGVGKKHLVPKKHPFLELFKFKFY